ncbi:MAG: hypothetical protein CVU63_09895, partial [Deltaproteobacteria bacterium HGW-Deltaproteobacteria-20]
MEKLARYLRPVVALVLPWRLGNASKDVPVGACFLWTVLAGIAVYPAISFTHRGVDFALGRLPEVRVLVPSGAHAVEDEGAGELAGLGFAVAVQKASWGFAWFAGGLASGMVTLGALVGMLYLCKLIAGASGPVLRGAAGMSLWLPISAVAFTWIGRSRGGEHATLLLVAAALLGVWIVSGVVVGATSMLGRAPKARRWISALVAGALVGLILAVGVQPAVQ